MNTPSILSSYENRIILLSGASGFVGKVLLALMLDRLPNLKKIYILIRKKKTASSVDRFVQEILMSPAFIPFSKKWSSDLAHFLSSRLKVIEGDIARPQFGVSDSIAQSLFSEIDLLIHVAGLIDFFPDMRQALDINILGALNAAEFVQKCKNASLIHISTCYVAGQRQGTIEEEIELEKSPNGKLIDAEEELTLLRRLVENTSRKYRMEIGRERALEWGWANSYCYSKALAEKLLVTRYPKIRYTIVRPSIIESAYRFPFPGWNEGANTSAPICYLAGGWYPYFLSRNEVVLDVVPVDYLCHAILKIGALLLNQSSSRIYQIGSSDKNPVTMGSIISMTRSWHRSQKKIHGLTWLERRIRTHKIIKCVPLDSFFAPGNLAKWISKWEKVLTKLGISKKFIFAVKKELQRNDRIFQSFLPFTHDCSYRFRSHLDEIPFLESEFEWDLKNLDWRKYWQQIHLPGMQRWIFPLFEGKKIEITHALIQVSEQERKAFKM